MRTKQSKFRLVAIALVSTTIASLTSCDTNLELVQSINEEFTEVNSIEIESSFLDVSYIGNPDMESVQLIGALESSKAGNFAIEYRVDQNTLIIEVVRHGIGGGNSRGYINLTGPQHMNMNLEAGSGNIQIHQVTAQKFEFDGGSGNIELGDIKAPLLELKLSSGKINAYDLIGDVELEISSGNASISNLEGDLNAVGSSGKFNFKLISGKVNSSLNSGNGILNGVQELGKLKISSGNYTVNNSYFGSNTQFEGSSGNFDIQTNSDLSDFNFDLKTSSGNIRVGGSNSSGSLKIDNGSPYTVSGVVSSGNIKIGN
ncbi:Putative adhesin [Algoriphagus winogradskyi]|uniref:Adhesin n=1 Tax=Algoriphagus winogradskyi TaxID=237017 RepID=A0ABY1P2F8_9BACT|nr:Putative adhesin [Algoriphagus winogradskyi]